MKIELAGAKMKTEMVEEYGMVRVVKKLENFYTSKEEKLKELSDNIFQGLEYLITKNEGFFLTNRSYTSKTPLFGRRIAKGALNYDIDNGRGKVGELKLDFSTKKDCGRLKIRLNIDKKWYDPMIVKDLTAQFEYYNFL